MFKSWRTITFFNFMIWKTLSSFVSYAVHILQQEQVFSIMSQTNTRAKLLEQTNSLLRTLKLESSPSVPSRFAKIAIMPVSICSKGSSGAFFKSKCPVAGKPEDFKCIKATIPPPAPIVPQTPLSSIPLNYVCRTTDQPFRPSLPFKNCITTNLQKLSLKKSAAKSAVLPRQLLENVTAAVQSRTTSSPENPLVLS